MVPLRVEVLGPLRLLVDGTAVDVPGHRRRALLALLALAGGHVVTTDALVDALWADDPPETGHRALHSHVSRLRRHLAGAAPRLERVGAGYRLRADEVDAEQVRTLARRCAAELRDDPAAAARTAAEALGSWRGVPLAEFTDVPPLAAEATGLHELRLRLVDDALEARLRSGDGSVTADATAAVAAEPLRERTILLLLQALAADGRAADALAAGAAYRRRVAEETGLDAGPAVAALEQSIAAGEDAPRPRVAPSRARLARPGGPLVGRELDASELRRLLGDHRLVTVAGPGGVGKTTLAVAVAADLADRDTDAALVGLAEVTDGARVPAAVVSALRLRIGGDPTPAAVADALADRPLLILLDNCEHVVEACRELAAALLVRAPHIRLLATSRVTLHVAGEYVVRLQPLPLPRATAAADELRQHPAVRAFTEHARRRDPALVLDPDDLPAVAEVIRGIDGLPLAIELAAGQLAVLPPAALRDRLGRVLDALSADRPAGDARHRTLRTTIDWSYRLLAEGERALLRALAVFPGGADLGTVESLAVQAVPGTDPLAVLRRLMDASLLGRDGDRYRILETVRAFLIDDLAARGEADAAERGFIDRMVQTARELGRALNGPDEGAADARLRAELANLRAARDLARRRGELDDVVDITLALDESVVFRDIVECWQWSIELAADPALRGHPLEAGVLGAATQAAWLAGDLPRAEELRTAALSAAEHTDEPAQLRRCWSSAGAPALFHGRFDEASRLWLAAAEVAEYPSFHLSSAALPAVYAGDRVAGLELARRALSAAEARPCPSHRAFALYALGEALAADDPEGAITAYQEAIGLARTAGTGFVEGVARVGLVSVWTAAGDLGAAAGGYRMLLDYWLRTGSATQLWTTLRNVAPLLAEHGLAADAALLLAAADAAPTASRLTGQDATRDARDRRALAAVLGEAATADLEARARALTPAAAAAVARAALDRITESAAEPARRNP